MHSLKFTLRHPPFGNPPFFSQRHLSNQETAPFNRSIKLKQRVRSALLAKLHRETTVREILPYDYFHTEVANRLIDRLDDIRSSDGFPLALEVGCGGNFVLDAICRDNDVHDPSEWEEGGGNRGGVRKLVQLDSCYEMLHRDEYDDDAVRLRSNSNDGLSSCETYKLVADEEGYPWSFPDGTFDLVISSMAMHWVNDLPKMLLEIKVSVFFFAWFVWMLVRWINRDLRCSFSFM